jgi:hypothetical protein
VPSSARVVIRVPLSLAFLSLALFLFAAKSGPDFSRIMASASSDRVVARFHLWISPLKDALVGEQSRAIGQLLLVIAYGDGFASKHFAKAG